MRICLLSMSTKRLWRGMFPLLALGQTVPTKSVVLEHVSQTLYTCCFLEPKLTVVFLP